MKTTKRELNKLMKDTKQAPVRFYTVESDIIDICEDYAVRHNEDCLTTGCDKYNNYPEYELMIENGYTWAYRLNDNDSINVYFEFVEDITSLDNVERLNVPVKILSWELI